VAAVAVWLALGLWFVTSGPASAAVVYSYEAQPGGVVSGEATAGKRPSRSQPRASGGPPLSISTASGARESPSMQSAEGDPLVDNGLASPLCSGSSSGGLSASVQGNCETSDFVAAAAPTKNYEIDVNIDVGPVGLGKGAMLSAIQDVFVTPVWNALEWVVHALVVMLEWCYTLNLLSGPTMGGVAHALRQAQASFTTPWLALVLASASVLALYNGLVRRRVTETLTQALMTVAMMSLGLWLIADPIGTVGAVGQWADEASLGTLGAVAGGTPANAPRTLADSMRTLFEGAIEMPWCYMEFGNVRWCSDPALLDPRLHRAGISIETRQKAMIGCKPHSITQLCVASTSPAARVVQRSDRLMREATTNGALFLAFAANGNERNAVSEEGSLLHVLCQGSDDTKCRGPTAAQAEFRSASGTFPRMIGLALVAIGILGMALLFGLIALRLFTAAIVSLFMLLLAPAAVLAPALGDTGRAVFGAWLTRLLGAVSSKLLYSFLLGTLLMMQRLLTSIESLGWWTQWLLISTFWWAVFLKRHQAAAFLQSGGRDRVSHGQRSIGGRMHSVRQVHNAVSHPVGWVRSKLLGEQLGRPGDPSRRSPASANKPTAGATVSNGGAGLRTVPSRREQRHPPAARALAKQAQLMRLRGAREAALAAGDRRRAAKLAIRGQRVEAELDRERSRSHDAGHAEVERKGAGFASPPGERAVSRDSRQLDSRLGTRSGTGKSMGANGGLATNRQIQRAAPDRSGRSKLVPPIVDSTGSSEARKSRSSIMEDAHAVAEKRKRQLGFGPPPGPRPADREPAGEEPRQ
jgi:hypothetical protein